MDVPVPARHTRTRLAARLFPASRHGLGRARGSFGRILGPARTGGSRHLAGQRPSIARALTATTKNNTSVIASTLTNENKGHTPKFVDTQNTSRAAVEARSFSASGRFDGRRPTGGEQGVLPAARECPAGIPPESPRRPARLPSTADSTAARVPRRQPSERPGRVPHRSAAGRRSATASRRQARA